MLGKYRERSFLALVLMVAQSFLYNSVFFTFGLILANFYHVPQQRVGFYLLPLAIGNFCGPLVLGSFFDTIGRRKMIAGTFGLSGLLLLITAYLFAAGLLSQVSQTAAWFVIFFFASAAASSAYLTASEIFPLCPGDRVLLCCRYRDRRKRFSASVWLADRIWIRPKSQYWLCDCCVLVDRCRCDGMETRRRCRRQIARKHRRPALKMIFSN